MLKTYCVQDLVIIANALCTWADTHAFNSMVTYSEIGVAVALGDRSIGQEGQRSFSEVELTLIHKAVTWYCDGKKGSFANC